MSVMSPRRLAMFTLNGEWFPDIPASAEAINEDTSSAGTEDVYTTTEEFWVEDRLGRAYKTETQDIATDRLIPLTFESAPCAACVVYAQAETIEATYTQFERFAAAFRSAEIMIGDWALVKDEEDYWTIPDLDSDTSDVAAAIKADWPASWRKWAEGDNQGQMDPQTGQWIVQPGNPTGPRYIAEMV